MVCQQNSQSKRQELIVVVVMSQHRNSVGIPIKLDDVLCQRLLFDKSLRIMIFCAGDYGGVQDIAFPHQSELKVNGGDVKANLRGLKNKPGSTRPVDITQALRLRPSNYNNNTEFTYALTSKVSGCTYRFFVPFLQHPVWTGR